MKKKTIIRSAVTIAIIVVVLTLISFFTKGVFTGKLYRVDNVYEEIWNMVNYEKNGTQTILTTAIERAYVDYDFGCFQCVRIPVNSEYKVVLSFDHDELCIMLFENDSPNHDCACYVYNYQSNTLYGNHEESLLFDNFLSLYYSWVGDDGKFNPENQGNYTYVFEEYPLSHERNYVTESQFLGAKSMLEIILDYVLEVVFFIGLVVIGCIILIVMTDKEIKTWIKTTVFLALSESFAAFIGWMGWQSYGYGNRSGAFVAVAIAVILAIVFLGVGIKGHKMEWSHVDSLI